MFFSGKKPNDAEIREALKNGATVIDVRTKEEFDSGNLAGSINIPHDLISSGINKRCIPQDKTIVVYCKAGGRAGMAKETLEKLGYKVYNAGGYSDICKLAV